ncbi:MAG: hypothetical protein ABL914_13790, partial [Novosphingobium sp.]|uniref:hypothetical protein n=1 Tax=Novosphingobium sp. TaxID=1874826 RepID=UPI0032BE188C
AGMLGAKPENSAGDLVAAMAGGQRQGLARGLEGLARLGRVQGMQAYCLDCAVAGLAGPPNPPQGWLVRLLGPDFLR